MLIGLLNRLHDNCKAVLTLSLSFFGFGFCRKWSSWTLESSSVLSLGIADLSLIVEAVGALALLAVAFASCRVAPLARRDVFVAGSTFSLVGGTAAMLFGAYLALPWICIVGAIVAAVGRSLFLLLWFELFGCLAPVQIAVAYAGSIVLSTLMSPILLNLDGAALGYAACLLPVISLVAYLESWRGVPAVRVPGVAKLGNLGIPYAKMALWVFLVSLACGVTRAGVGAPEWTAYLARLVPNLLVVGGVVAARRLFDLDRVYALSFACMVFGLAVLFAFPGSILSFFLSTIGEECSNLIFFVVSCGMAYRTRTSAALPCGLLFSVRSVGTMLAIAAGGAIDRRALALMGFAAVLIAFAVVFRGNNLMAMWDLEWVYPGDAAASHAKAAAVGAAAERANLSERETRVLECLARGMSTSEIASELFIAEGTVRAHTSRIYAKTGTHSRAELESLLEGGGTAGRASS